MRSGNEANSSPFGKQQFIPDVNQPEGIPNDSSLYVQVQLGVGAKTGRAIHLGVCDSIDSRVLHVSLLLYYLW